MRDSSARIPVTPSGQEGLAEARTQIPQLRLRLWQLQRSRLPPQPYAELHGGERRLPRLPPLPPSPPPRRRGPFAKMAAQEAAAKTRLREIAAVVVVIVVAGLGCRGTASLTLATLT